MPESDDSRSGGVGRATDGIACAAEPILRDLRVLVVDDIAENCELVGFLLGLRGAAVTTAESGGAGLLAMEAERFDVVVSDISMPAMDGFEFLRRIRERETGDLAHVPVIALTALSSPIDRAATAEAGFCAHMCKPSDSEKLALFIAAAAGRSSARPD